MMHQWPTQAGTLSSPEQASWRPCLAVNGVGTGGAGGGGATVIGGEGGDIIGGEGGEQIGAEG